MVLGAPDSKSRNSDVSALFDYAFSQYQSHKLIADGDPIGTVRVEKGDKEIIELKADHPYSVLLKKGEKLDAVRYELKYDEPLKAPIAVGQRIGKIVVLSGDAVLKEYDIESPVAVAEANWWTLLKRMGSRLFFIE